MNKLMMTVCVACATVSAFADGGPKSVREILEREDGGRLNVRAKNTKAVFYVNAQSRVSESLLLEAKGTMETLLRTPIGFTNGTFDVKSPKIYGELSFYIIDDESLPMSLVAPEGRWGFMNVAPLTKGRGEKPAFLAARVKKEMARIGCLTLGGIGSSYRGNIMGFVPDAETLDKFDNDCLPFDCVQSCSSFLAGIGVKPWRRITYRKACMEGIAPEPTNDVQRAVWKAVHEMPKQPLKLEKPAK